MFADGLAQARFLFGFGKAFEFHRYQAGRQFPQGDQYRNQSRFPVGEGSLSGEGGCRGLRRQLLDEGRFTAARITQ
ncbi:MAG: hypothetical protein BWY25_00595 [Chloroflexi bacterium ADurb.Bin222]|nr:MAG: hypothetical protein BWY25_00595 [Chloroflexi bacterium ADurb.Bin222]